MEIYIPRKALKITLLNPSTIHHDMTELDEFKIISLKYELSPLTSMVFSLTYELPEDLFLDNLYTFKFIKQSGVEMEYLRQSATVPPQYLLSSDLKDDNLLIKDTMCSSFMRVREDCFLSLHLEKNPYPPRIYAHHFIKTNVIKVKFNEPVIISENDITVLEKGNRRKFSIKGIALINDNKILPIELSDFPQKVAGIQILLILKNVRNIFGENGCEKRVTCIHKLKIKN